MASKDRRDDHVPTEKQLALAEWFAEYKSVELPSDVATSNRAWWGWINSLLTRIDREDAREAQIDFGIAVDYSDPVSIIGALRFRSEVNSTSLIDRALQMLKAKSHPYDVQDYLHLTDDQLAEATKIYELKYEEIDWGSI